MSFISSTDNADTGNVGMYCGFDAVLFHDIIQINTFNVLITQSISVFYCEISYFLHA